MWDLAFTPEVIGHGQGQWECCEGYLDTEGEREYLYKKKKKWREQEQETESNGRDRGMKVKGTLVSVNRGICRGGKAERGEGENTQGTKEDMHIKTDL